MAGTSAALVPAICVFAIAAKRMRRLDGRDDRGRMICRHGRSRTATNPARSSGGARATNCDPISSALIDTLLPRLARRSDASRRLPELKTPVSGPGRRRSARDRLWRRRIPDRAGAKASPTKASSASSLSSTAWPKRSPRSRARTCAISACTSTTRPNLIAWLPRHVAGADRPDPSRPVAEAPALETPLCPGRHGGAARPHPAAGRRISLRDRHRRLCRLDAAASAALARFRMDGGMRRRLARSLGPAFSRHATTPKPSDRIGRVLSDLSQNLKSP